MSQESDGKEAGAYCYLMPTVEEASESAIRGQILADLELIKRADFEQIDDTLFFGNLHTLAVSYPDSFEEMFVLTANTFANFADRVVYDLQSGVFDPDSDPGVLDMLKDCFDDLELDKLPHVFAAQNAVLRSARQKIYLPVIQITKNEILFCRNAVRRIRELIRHDADFDFLEEQGFVTDRENPFEVIFEARAANDPDLNAHLEAISEIAERIRTLIHQEDVVTSKALSDIGLNWAELALFESEAAQVAFCAVFDFIDRRHIPNYLEFGLIKMFVEPPEKTMFVRAWTYKDFALNSPAPLDKMMQYCPNWLIAEA